MSVTNLKKWVFPLNLTRWSRKKEWQPDPVKSQIYGRLHSKIIIKNKDIFLMTYDYPPDKDLSIDMLNFLDDKFELQWYFL